MKKYTINDYINKCNDLNLQFISTHKEFHKGTVIDFICNKHKDKGVQSTDWSHFKTYTKGCPYCAGKKKTTKDIIPLIKNKDVEIISEYVGFEKSITCSCKKCSNVWNTTPKVLISNGGGCPVCGKEKSANHRRKTTQEFILELNEINPNIEVLEEYKSIHSKIKCRCKIDGTVWYGYPANLLNQSAGCPNCNLSNSERKMITILRKIGLKIAQQYSFSDCKYKYKLKFDAFDTENCIAFEYNGEQHYKPIDFSGQGQKWAEKQFELTQKRDNIKIQYCKENKIPMVVVPYWEKDNMESFILNKLNRIGVYKN